MKKVLVLGSEGFIGLNVVKKGLEKKYDMFGCDIEKRTSLKYKYYNISLNSESFTYLLRCEKFDFIINCAGSGNVAFSIENPVLDFELNVKNLICVLDSIRLYQPETKLLHISSAAVYGNPVELPVSESAIINPISPYGFNKYQSEILCSQFSRLFSLNISIVRPFSVYGPGLKKQIIWDTYVKGMNSDTIQLFGTGTETRDYIYIDDLVESLYYICNYNCQSFEIFNVASGVEVSLHTLILKLMFHLQWNNKKLEFNNLVRKGDPLNWRADISKLTSIGFSCSCGIDDGILKTSKWLSSNVSRKKSQPHNSQ